MIGDILDLAVGAAGTVLYLWLWSRLQAAVGGRAGAPRPQRRRLLQATFFLLLTPYVLILFWLMENVGTWVEAWLNGTPP